MGLISSMNRYLEKFIFGAREVASGVLKNAFEALVFIRSSKKVFNSDGN